VDIEPPDYYANDYQDYPDSKDKWKYEVGDDTRVWARAAYCEVQTKKEKKQKKRYSGPDQTDNTHPVHEKRLLILGTLILRLG
jgi:hypothetical protein